MRNTGGYAAAAVAILMLASMLGIAFERNLVGTLTQQGWGRTLQGIGAALTTLRCGVSGFVIDRRLDNFLRIGGFDGNPHLLDRFQESYTESLLNKKRLQRTLDQAKSVSCAPSASNRDASGHYVNLIGFAGEDAGMSSYTLVAFSLFGINVRGLTFTYFGFVACSLILFTLRYGRNPGAMVAAALTTTALYLSLCSLLFNFTMSSELGSLPGIDIKDPRFLGSIAAIPLLHIILTWMQWDHRMTALDYAVLALQSAILAFAIHLRFPVMWTLLIPLFLWSFSTCAAMWREPGSRFRPGDWRSPRSLCVIAVISAVLGAGQLAVSCSYHPFYDVERDIPRHTFWDGVLQSLEYNPNWKAKYGGLVQGATGDELPLAAVRVAIAELPGDQQQQYLQPDGNPTRLAYETFSKAVFMRILSQDPRFVLETFLTVKPLLILRSEAAMYRSLVAGLGSWHLLVVVLGLITLGWITARHLHSLKFLSRLAVISGFCATIAWLPNWLVLANELVMFDNFIWALLSIVLALTIFAASLFRIADRALWRAINAPAISIGEHAVALSIRDHAANPHDV